jgi:hypothetical protein
MPQVQDTHKLHDIRVGAFLSTPSSAHSAPFSQPSTISQLLHLPTHSFMPLTLGPHATGLDRDHVLCQCPELGCNEMTIKYNGRIHQGRKFSRQTYPKHLQRATQVAGQSQGAAISPASVVVQPPCTTPADFQGAQLSNVSNSVPQPTSLRGN